MRCSQYGIWIPVLVRQLCQSHPFFPVSGEVIVLRKCFFFLLLGLALFTQDARSEQRPNILFVFTDDHAPHAIGAYEGWLQSVNPTPNIDKLAKEGMLFRNSFCTNSICGPSRAVIQTGLHSHLNGFRDNREKFNGDQRTFPKLLQKAGYQTVMLGKWHLVTNPQGFDHWKVLPGQGAYYNPAFITPKGREVIEGYCTNIVTDLAIKWLKEERDPNKPFMMMCQHKAPHRTWMPPLEYLELYDDVDIPEPETLFDRWEDNASPARNQEMEIDGHLNIVFDCFGPPIHGWDPYAGKSVDRSGAKNLEQMTAAQLARWNEVFDRKNN
ncbi:MAG: sulfatase-like hydrolase/transferase, partial [Planctomycetaceae bacterium]|nr:sulfatase-like hydrolase/transferase [Planctomycetaceae bacterium]